MVLCIFALVGCAEQNPARIITVKPSVARLPAKKISKPQIKTEPAKIIVKNKIIKQKSVTKDVMWIWPAKGAILTNFSSGQATLKGIDIAGIEGTPILAASEGEVVYSGNSLRGYGNLIIIKHQKNFLSAYAHNSKNMVKEGERVAAGQRIAQMGKTGTDRVKLHFEVRHHGKPIDPESVLPNR